MTSLKVFEKKSLKKSTNQKSKYLKQKHKSNKREIILWTDD